MSTSVLNPPLALEPTPHEAPPNPRPYQDEFPQVKLAFQAVVGGLHLEGISLSLDKALVHGELPHDLEYQDELISLRFDFEGYALTLFADVILTQESDAPHAPITLHFTNPSDPHLAPLRYLINSYIAGDLVTVGNLLSHQRAIHHRETISEPDPRPQTVRFAARLLLILALSLGLFALAAQTFYERIILSYEPNPVQITLPEYPLRARASGQIAYMNANAAKGDVAVTQIANSGVVFDLVMPCDCQAVVAPGVFEGATMLAGDRIFTLYERLGPLSAEIRLSENGIARYLAGDHASLEFANGQTVPVSIGSTAAGQDGAMRLTLIQPDPELVGQDQTRIGRLRFSKIAPDFWQRLAARIRLPASASRL